jgi:selenocysteine-specific elongation factor
MTVVVGTAGHIDHGKTTLLRALTGIDADRLPEERRRGMTIDVGYAHLELPDGSQLDFVDVPGHDKLVGNMLVGAGEIDAALLVVAADDGPRPQTLEHLELLDALGIADGLAVVTKTDAVAPERAAEVVAATRALLDRTSLRGAPVLAVSATSGEGLVELRETLVALVAAVVGRGLPDGPARLAIDRAFTVKGRGTVVTGTLRGGPLERGMTLRVLPGGREARIREVQVHGATVGRASNGGRTALNLGGIEAGDLHRGMVLTASGASIAGTPIASDRLLVALRPVAGLIGDLHSIPADRTRVRFHAGTEQVGAVVGRSGRDGADLPGGEVAAILRLERPVAVAPGDRFVLRRPSPGGTLAGGRVIDAAPPRGISRRRATPERLAALAAARAPESAAAARLALHGAITGATAGNPVRLADDVTATVADVIVASVRAASAWLPLAEVRTLAAASLRRMVSVSALDARTAATSLVDQLARDGRFVKDGERLGLPGAAPAGLSHRTVTAMAALEAMLDVSAPPPLSEAAQAAGCPPDGLRALESAGRIVRLDDDLAYAVNAYRRLELRAIELATAAPLAPAALRDATGTSRKYVMAILEDLDRRGVLRRTPAGHVPGPRAAAATRP